MSFLTAEWRKLAIINYEINPSILSKYVPFGTELDLWQGKCYVSLIGFMFVNTRLLGIKIPFHTNFEEVNLRFYVKHFEGKEWKRGVVFIKEIVPKSAITFIANTIYQENYETMPMKHDWVFENDKIEVKYEWKKSQKWYLLKVTANKELLVIEPNSEAEFITEHYWGYAKNTETNTNEYGVRHPRWEQYKVLDYEVNVDFETIYGSEFSFLNEQTPISVILAEGSAISIENKITIK